MTTTLTIISRQSPLALLQVEELERLLAATGADVRFRVVTAESYGDRHKEVSLMDPALSPDFFTRELDRALLDGEADIAVHSAKDLPYPLPAGLEVVALTAAGDKSDSLVTRTGATLSQLPAGSRVGTSSAQRKAELLSLRPDMQVVPIRGTIEERLAQVDDGTVDALVVATCALQRLGLQHRAAERLPFATHPLQGNLAVTATTAVADRLRGLFAPIDIRRRYRRVLLVGFGPGAPDLLTLRGQKALEEAAAIYYDDLTNERLLCRFAGRKVYVGKRSGRHSHAQDDINALLYAAATEPVGDAEADALRPVVRLKGGDPMLFSHGREEADYLRQRMVEVEVVPGVSSGNAMASLLQLPLTHRGVARSVAFVLGHGAEVQTPSADTLLYYMGGAQLHVIAQSLLRAGRAPETPVAIVSDVSLPGQRVVVSTLGELRWAIYRATPVLIAVGEVVGFLANERRQRVYYTGTTLPPSVPRNDDYALLPLIEIEGSGVSQPPAAAYDWVVFTSRHGVRHYTQPLDGARVASVGPVTSAELRGRGVEPAFESPTESAEGLIEFFGGLPPCRILLPRSDKGLRALTDGLRGHQVTDLPVYTNRPAADAVRQDLSLYDKVVLTSPSTVEAFRRLYREEETRGLLLVAKGKTTFNALSS